MSVDPVERKVIEMRTNLLLINMHVRFQILFQTRRDIVNP